MAHSNGNGTNGSEFGLVVEHFKRLADGTIAAKRVEMDPNKKDEELQLLRALLGEPASEKKTPADGITLSQLVQKYVGEQTRAESWTEKRSRSWFSTTVCWSISSVTCQ